MMPVSADLNFWRKSCWSFITPDQQSRHLTNKADTTMELLWKGTFQVYTLATPVVCTLVSEVYVVINGVTFCNTYRYSLSTSPDSRMDPQNVLCSETLFNTFFKFFSFIKNRPKKTQSHTNVG
jgi:hypothetical protein